jgi:hypothetical protein
MSDSPPPRQPHQLPQQGGGDPWAAFGYLVAGVGAYGLLGWGLGVWLNASYLTAVGILVGAVLSLVLIFYQFGRSTQADRESGTGDGQSGPDASPRGQSTEDRGETE